MVKHSATFKYLSNYFKIAVQLPDMKEMLRKKLHIVVFVASQCTF